MGKIVYAAAMSHVLYPEYYGKNVGPHGRRMVEALIAEVQAMGKAMLAARPDALIVVADDHLNVFSYDAVPALCVRIGRSVDRMVQADAIEFDRALDGLPVRYPLHEELANRILEQGIDEGFDLAASWSAPLDHAFLSPVSTLCGAAPSPPLVPFWVNCFVAPRPTARRCFAAGRLIAGVVAGGPWRVAVIATGGLSHFPELSLARVGQSDPGFDRRVVGWLEAGDHEALCALTAKELHETGSHELLNWMVLIGAVSPTRGRVRFFGEMGRIDLAAVEWDVAAGAGAADTASPAATPHFGAAAPHFSAAAPHFSAAASHFNEVDVILYRLKKDAAFRARFQADAGAALAGADLTDEVRAALVAWDPRRLNELGGSLHLLVSIPHLGKH